MAHKDAAEDFTVFITFASGDIIGPNASKRWLAKLLEQLEPLDLEKRINVWSELEIETGLWDVLIKEQLQKAKFVVLLVSPALLATKHIRNGQLPASLLKAKKKGAEVLPLILSPSLFSETKFKYPDPVNGPEEFSLSVFLLPNPLSEPLDAMQEHEQDMVLRALAQLILQRARQHSVAFKSLPNSPPHSIPVNWQNDNAAHLATGRSLADALIVWDPEVVAHEDYVTLITALGDLVRSQGGIGVERIGHLGIGIPVSEDMLV